LDTNIMDATLEQFLDDTAPEDVLGRLNHVVWAVQAGTLGIILNSTDSPEFMDLLEESSWKLGRSCVETRWSALTQKGSQDLRDIVLALQDSPLSGYPFMNGYLVKRATHKEIQIELESCPHRSQFAELQPVAASLCNLHSHWIRGYTSGLNSKIKVTHEQGPRKCLQRWTLN
jgi:predicted ArsR family transcriptional regulator